MLDTIERPSTDKITEPAKRWRNKWKALVHSYERHAPHIKYAPGQIFDGYTVWPSKDVAEQKAALQKALYK